jgi:hypothetical protein
MRLNEAVPALYAWADAHGTEILAASLFLPVAGTVLARIGKGGRDDSDGRFIASSLVGLSIVLFMAEVLLLVLAGSVLGIGLGEANVQLLLAPILCLAGSLIGVRLVFPLSELASVRTLMDVGVFMAACLLVLWFFSQFRGWGILFLGSVTELIVLLVLGGLLMRRLYRRAFGSPVASSASTVDQHLERVRRMAERG